MPSEGAMAILTYNGRPLDGGSYLPPFSYTKSGMLDGPSANGRYIWEDRSGKCFVNKGSISKRFTPSNNKWTKVTSSISADGLYIWSDGLNDYYSNGTSQYTVRYGSGLGFLDKTWTGLTSFWGTDVWSDGNNYYYSDGSHHYVLDISNSAWSQKTWTGFTSFIGQGIWSDGTNYYYSYKSDQYVLDISTSRWRQKTWTGLTSFFGRDVWKLGEHIYYSSGNDHYKLDTATSTWKPVYPGISFSGRDVWSYSGTTYVSTPTYILSENVIQENNFISYETT